MLRIKQGPKVTLEWTCDISTHRSKESTWLSFESPPSHHLSVCINHSTKHITWHQAFLCVVMWHTHRPSFLQLLLPMWKPWQRPVGTSLWHIAFILCEVWGRVQVLPWEKMEPRPREPKTFQNGGRPQSSTYWLPVWLLSDHLIESTSVEVKTSVDYAMLCVHTYACTHSCARTHIYKHTHTPK